MQLCFVVAGEEAFSPLAVIDGEGPEMRFQKLAELWVILARRNCLGKTCQVPARFAPISDRAGKAVRSEWSLIRLCQEALAGSG